MLMLKIRCRFLYIWPGISGRRGADGFFDNVAVNFKQLVTISWGDIAAYKDAFRNENVN